VTALKAFGDHEMLQFEASVAQGLSLGPLTRYLQQAPLITRPHLEHRYVLLAPSGRRVLIFTTERASWSTDSLCNRHLYTGSQSVSIYEAVVTGGEEHLTYTLIDVLCHAGVNVHNDEFGDRARFFMDARDHLRSIGVTVTPAVWADRVVEGGIDAANALIMTGDGRKIFFMNTGVVAGRELREWEPVATRTYTAMAQEAPGRSGEYELFCRADGCSQSRIFDDVVPSPPLPTLTAMSFSFAPKVFSCQSCIPSQLFIVEVSWAGGSWVITDQRKTTCGADGVASFGRIEADLAAHIYDPVSLVDMVRGIPPIAPDDSDFSNIFQNLPGPTLYEVCCGGGYHSLHHPTVTTVCSFDTDQSKLALVPASVPKQEQRISTHPFGGTHGLLRHAFERARGSSKCDSIFCGPATISSFKACNLLLSLTLACAVGLRQGGILALVVLDLERVQYMPDVIPGDNTELGLEITIGKRQYTAVDLDVVRRLVEDSGFAHISTMSLEGVDSMGPRALELQLFTSVGIPAVTYTCMLFALDQPYDLPYVIRQGVTNYRIGARSISIALQAMAARLSVLAGDRQASLGQGLTDVVAAGRTFIESIRNKEAATSAAFIGQLDQMVGNVRHIDKDVLAISIQEKWELLSQFLSRRSGKVIADTESFPTFEICAENARSLGRLDRPRWGYTISFTDQPIHYLVTPFASADTEGRFTTEIGTAESKALIVAVHEIPIHFESAVRCAIATLPGPITCAVHIFGGSPTTHTSAAALAAAMMGVCDRDHYFAGGPALMDDATCRNELLDFKELSLPVICPVGTFATTHGHPDNWQFQTVLDGPVHEYSSLASLLTFYLLKAKK
jgi:hypothetical protein